MNKKILYIACVAILIIDIIITMTIGLRVNLYYGEGYTISFTQEDTIELNDIKSIAKEIWKNNFIIQRIEFFEDSAKIKVKEASEEQIQQLCDKVNEKYSSELTTVDFRVEHVSNVKISSLVEPFIAPIIISLVLIVAYLGIRFKNTKNIIRLLLNITLLVSIMFTLHAICRLPISEYTIPLFMTLYALIIIVSPIKWEKEK